MTLLRAGRSFQLLDSIAILKIDVFPRELVPGELSRSVVKELFPGLLVSIASLPDAAISKLIWISKGSHKSRHDLKHILFRATDEELSFVRANAAELNLTALLNEVLAEPDEIDV